MLWRCLLLTDNGGVYGHTHGAPNEHPPPIDLVDNEGETEQTGQWTRQAPDIRQGKNEMAFDTQGLLHDRLVVVDGRDSTDLLAYLDSIAEDQALPI